MNIIREETTTIQVKSIGIELHVYIFIVLYCTDEAKRLKQYCL